jgi:ferritin-like metal-binding protein YciE
MQFLETKMSLNNMHDLLVSQLSDVYSAETQLTKALPKMADAASSATLKAAFSKHLIETEAHVQRLGQIFAIIKSQPLAKTCKAMQGLIEEGNDTMHEEGEDSVIDAALIAAAQRVEHYEISAYGTLRTLAGTIGLDAVITLLDQTLEEEKAADVKLTQIAEAEVNPAAASVAGAR